MSSKVRRHHGVAASIVVGVGALCAITPFVAPAAAIADTANDAKSFEGLWWPREEPGEQRPPPDGASPPPPGSPDQGPGFSGPSQESQLNVVKCSPVQQLIIAGGGLSSLVFQNDREIVMVAEFGMDFVRTIYLGAQHPQHVEPQANGHSIGHWDGNTLVVDTIGFADKQGKDKGMHTVERITKNGNKFDDEIVIEERNAPPRHQTVRYELRPEQPFNEYVCEESFDRYQFVNGQLDNPNLPPSRNRKGRQ